MAGDDVMAEYHADSRCGSCAGPPEADRDAVCHSCVPQYVWFAVAAADAADFEAAEAGGE
jgi:hypothetical protein